METNLLFTVTREELVAILNKRISAYADGLAKEEEKIETLTKLYAKKPEQDVDEELSHQAPSKFSNSIGNRQDKEIEDARAMAKAYKKKVGYYTFLRDHLKDKLTFDLTLSDLNDLEIKLY